MTPEQMVALACQQQQLTGRKDADVAFIVPGKWPDSGKKRLFGRKGGPVGQCIGEDEDAVLCLFKADEVIRACSRLLRVVTLTPEELDAVLVGMKEKQA